jgi:hypothetical protein
VADDQAGNAAQIEFWNSAATRAWADEYARMDRAVAAPTKELLDLAAPQPGERVLDSSRAAPAQEIALDLTRQGQEQPLPPDGLRLGRLGARENPADIDPTWRHVPVRLVP